MNVTDELVTCVAFAFFFSRGFQGVSFPVRLAREQHSGVRSVIQTLFVAILHRDRGRGAVKGKLAHVFTNHAVMTTMTQNTRKHAYMN